jgi:hypothetical protein
MGTAPRLLDFLSDKVWNFYNSKSTGQSPFSGRLCNVQVLGYTAVEGGGYGGRYTPFFPLYLSPYLPIFALKPGFIWPVARGSYSRVAATLSVFRSPSASVSAKLGQKALFFHKAYRILYLPTYLPLAVISAFVSAICHERLAEHFRICLCICHLPRTTGRTLYLPVRLEYLTNTAHHRSHGR